MISPTADSSYNSPPLPFNVTAFPLQPLSIRPPAFPPPHASSYVQVTHHQSFHDSCDERTVQSVGHDNDTASCIQCTFTASRSWRLSSVEEKPFSRFFFWDQRISTKLPSGSCVPALQHGFWGWGCIDCVPAFHLPRFLKKLRFLVDPSQAWFKFSCNVCHSRMKWGRIKDFWWWPHKGKSDGFGGSPRWYHNWVPSPMRPNEQWTTTLFTNNTTWPQNNIGRKITTPEGLLWDWIYARTSVCEREKIWNSNTLYCSHVLGMPIWCLQTRPPIPSLNRHRMHTCVQANGNSNLFESRF